MRTDHVGASNNPNLGPLANNDASTLTMLPQPASPLIDGVPSSSCQVDGAAGITIDQRGQPRPDSASPNCDIGAVEVQPAAAPAAVLITPKFTGYPRAALRRIAAPADGAARIAAPQVRPATYE